MPKPPGNNSKRPEGANNIDPEASKNHGGNHQKASSKKGFVHQGFVGFYGLFGRVLLGMLQELLTPDCCHGACMALDP